MLRFHQWVTPSTRQVGNACQVGHAGNSNGVIKRGNGSLLTRAEEHAEVGIKHAEHRALWPCVVECLVQHYHLSS